MIGIDVSKSNFLTLATASVIAVIIMSWIYYILRFHLGYEYGMGLIPIIDIFDVDEESSIPTWLSSILLAISGFMAFCISKRDSSANRRNWLGVAALLAFLSLDEGSRVHERSQLLAVFVVLVIFALSGGIRNLTFLSRIPRTVALHLVLGAVLFVVGSILVDSINSPYIQEHGRDNLVYRGWATLEEGLEFSGILLLLRGLIHQLRALGELDEDSSHRSMVMSSDGVFQETHLRPARTPGEA